MDQKNIPTLDERLKSNELQFVTFTLATETYGIKVEDVQEIIGMTPVRLVPNAPNFMRGVISLRGSVVPVLDMRLVFKMEERLYDAFTVIIIVEAHSRLIGMIVDSVLDVSNIPVSTIQDTPQCTHKIETDFIEGIGRMGESMVILFDVNKIAAIETVSAVSDASVDRINEKNDMVHADERA
jgi:purine-binding chemotaxis protein CheW